MSHSLRHRITQIQQDTSAAVQRLFVLAAFIIIVGQILHMLFRKWVEKIARVSEAYLLHRMPSTHSIDPNFKEDREITRWLSRFARAVETEEQRRFLAQRNFRMLLFKASTPVFGTNQKGQIVVWNPALQDLTGYSEDEVVGRSISELFDNATASSQVQGEQPVADFMIDIESKSGESVHLVVSQLVIRTTETPIDQADYASENIENSTLYFIAQNLSELKRAQAKLIHASRLAALGEMASSFAHELNQPLNVITLSAGALLENSKNGSVSIDYLISKAERIEQQAIRAGKVIQGIRSFVLKIGDEESGAFDPV